MARIALVVATTGHASYTNTKAALERAGHVVTAILDNSLGSADLAPYDVFVVLRGTNTTTVAGQLRALIDAGRPMVISTVDNGTTAGASKSQLLTKMNLTGTFTASSVDANELLITAEHYITSERPAARARDYVGLNWAAALTSGQPMAGVALATDDPDSGNAGNVALAAIESGTNDIFAQPINARVVWFSHLYAGQTDYTEAGMQLVNRAVAWVFGETTVNQFFKSEFGLLAQRIAGHAEFPMNAAEWTPDPGGPALSVVGGKLRASSEGLAHFNPIDYRHSGAVVVRATVNLPANSFGGAAVLEDDRSEFGLGYISIGVQTSISEGEDSMVASERRDGFSAASFFRTYGLDRFPGVEYRMGYGADNGALYYVLRDFEGNLENQMHYHYRHPLQQDPPPGGYIPNDGRLGIYMRSWGEPLQVDIAQIDFYGSPYIRVKGTEWGMSAELRDAAGGVLEKHWAGSDGVIYIPGLKYAFNRAHQIVLYSFQGRPMAVLTPSGGIGPGDTFYSTYPSSGPALPSGAPNTPKVMRVDQLSTNFKFFGSDFSHPANLVTHKATRWQIIEELGDFATPVHDQIVTKDPKTQMDWTSVCGIPHLVRVQYQGTNDEWSEWSAPLLFNLPPQPPPRPANAFGREVQADFDRPSVQMIDTSITQFPDAIVIDQNVGFSMGPVALSNGLQGLLNRAWMARATDTAVYLAKGISGGWDTDELLFEYTGAPILRIGLAFDQNANVTVCAERATGAGGELQVWVYFFDSSAGSFVFTNFGNGRTPEMLLDDPKRLSDSEVLLFYIRQPDNTLCFRKQTDRYTIEYTTAKTGDDRYVFVAARTMLYRLRVDMMVRENGIYWHDPMFSYLYPIPVDERINFGFIQVPSGQLVFIPQPSPEEFNFPHPSIVEGDDITELESLIVVYDNNDPENFDFVSANFSPTGDQLLRDVVIRYDRNSPESFDFISAGFTPGGLNDIDIVVIKYVAYDIESFNFNHPTIVSGVFE